MTPCADFSFSVGTMVTSFLENKWFDIHSRPQSPSFLGHVVGKCGEPLVGYKLSRVALGTRMVLYPTFFTGCFYPVKVFIGTNRSVLTFGPQAINNKTIQCQAK